MGQTDLALRALDRLAQTVGEVLLKHPSFKDIEMYLMASAELTPEAIIDRIQTIIHNHFLREDIVSTAELLIEKGKLEGRLEGLREGEARGEARGEVRGEVRGKLQARLEVARKLRASGMQTTQIAAVCGLSEAELAQL